MYNFRYISFRGDIMLHQDFYIIAAVFWLAVNAAAITIVLRI